MELNFTISVYFRYKNIKENLVRNYIKENIHVKRNKLSLRLNLLLKRNYCDVESLTIGLYTSVESCRPNITKYLNKSNLYWF